MLFQLIEPVHLDNRATFATRKYQYLIFDADSIKTVISFHNYTVFRTHMIKKNLI